MTPRIDLQELAGRESEQTEWKENVADVDDVVATLSARQSAMEPWDRRPCIAATEDDLDLFILREVLRRLGSKEAAAEAPRYLSDSVALSAVVPPLLVREPLTNVLRPRNFAVLFFGRDVQRFIPGAISFFSKYEDVDRASPRGQRLELANTLLDQLRVLLPTVEAEAVTLYDKTNMEQPSVLKYPARAIREAVVNAFAHRDYSRVDPLRVTAFRDRIEISSPGALPFGVEPEELAAGTAAPHWRNQTLAWFLSRLGYAEAEGQGTRTIRTSLAAAGCPPAEFRADAVRVVCTLHAHPRATRRLESL